MSGCSCTSDPGDPGNGNGNTGNPRPTDGNGSATTVGRNGSTIIVGGSIAGGVVVTLLIVAMVTGAAGIGILVWRRKQSVYAPVISKYSLYSYACDPFTTLNML